MSFIPLLAAFLLPAQQLLTQSVDSRISNERNASLDRFLNYPRDGRRGLSRPNPAFWARDVDLTCASPWNSIGGNFRACTLISKRHVITVRHYPIDPGATVYFVDAVGNVHSRRVTGVRKFAEDDADIMVGVLDAEVPEGIHPAKILPEDYAKYIGNGEGLPVATFSYNEQFVVTELRAIPANRYMNIKCSMRIPEFIRSRLISEGPRAKFCKLLDQGDCGNPAFLIAGTVPILIYCDTTNNASSGPQIHLYRKEIQAAMDELCPGYKLEVYDFDVCGKMCQPLK